MVSGLLLLLKHKHAFGHKFFAKTDAEQFVDFEHSNCGTSNGRAAD